MFESAEINLADKVITQTVGGHNNDFHAVSSKESLGRCNRRTCLTATKTMVHEQTTVGGLVAHIFSNKFLVVIDFYFLVAFVSFCLAGRHVEFPLFFCGENRSKLIFNKCSESTPSHGGEDFGIRYFRIIGVRRFNIEEYFCFLG